MEHTPGPWKYVTRIQRGTYSQPVKGNPVRHYVTGPRPSQNFAEPLICHLGPTYDRAEANARLIAAAPELLEAAKFALSILGAYEAAAKRGENNLHKHTDCETVEMLIAAIAKAEGK